MSGLRTDHADPYEPWLGGMPCATEVGAAGPYLDRVVERHRARWGLE